jgi:hypothetical protein
MDTCTSQKALIGAALIRPAARRGRDAGRAAIRPCSRQLGPAHRLVSLSGERLGADLICPRTGHRYQVVERDRLVEAH